MLVTQAAQGKLGILAGSDYRGASAIGYSLKIPDTDWFMISKIDIDEVYAPVRQRAYIAAVLAFLLLSVTSLSLFFWWRKRAAQYQAAQLQYELTQQFLSRQNEYLSKHANDIILLMDKSGNIMEANDRAEEAYGLPRASLIGKSLPELRIPVERDAFKPLWSKIRQNRSLMFESAHLRFDGTEFPVEVSARMIERGTEQFVQYIIRDITERKAALAREHRLLDMYRALGATNEAIIHLQAESDLFPLVCRIAVEHGGMVLAWIGVAEEGGRFIPVASNGRPEGYLDDLASLTSPDAAEGKSIAETACRENRSAVANDIGREESTLPWRETNRKYGIQSMAAFPIMRSGRSCAVLMVYSDHVNAFDAEIVQLLERIKASISFALDNFDKETERRQSEEALKLAAMVYRDSNEAMMILDVESRIIAVNPAFERITCYKAGDVLGESPDILRSERQGGHTYESMWEDIGMTGHWKGELWCRTRIGDDFAVMLSINTTYAPDGSPQQRLVLFSDITKKKESDELIWSQANFDALTGLPNRRLFRDQLGREVKKTRRTGLPLAVMFLDLDGFKDVNDTLGHDMGDILLKGAADRLNGCVREIDAVARLGGDEFTVILSELHDPGDVDRVARHILQELSEPFQLGDELAHVSASIGITFYPEDATEIEDLLKNADQAMYAAKQRGRNQYQYFTASMQETAQAKMRLVNDLRVALEGNQFELVYQPIVELASGAIHKAEALIRWQHPTRGSINPAEFIPAAEDTGMINAFGDWVFHEAAKQAAIWRGKYRPDFQISVNISPVQFRNEGIDSTVWFDHLERLGLPAQGIVVEITEGLLLEASENVTRQLLAFRDAGIEVALDDFGIGYSSLSYLKKFDIDYLKIDQSFIRNLAKESDDMALCEAIIVMAHKLGLKVVAEGVETERQRDLLVDAGCDYMQGYLFSEPLSALEIEKLLGVNTFAI
jgi:diguanylate cyclase (GGDEF)-like protein/PAS domain S-box-containing protein